jgi:peptide methionine sulfoxide reductase msrA/msrB
MSTQLSTAYFASGCFWGTEYYFGKAAGVVKTEAGFMSGHVDNPSYKEVKTGTTGHLECVAVTYDPAQTSYGNLAGLFFETHDFTQTDGQGPDIGTQYLSCLYYSTPEEKAVGEKYFAILREKGYDVATMLRPATTFWKAEDYHQQYYVKKGDVPYCHKYTKIF